MLDDADVLSQGVSKVYCYEDSLPQLINYIAGPMPTCGITLNFRPNCGLGLTLAARPDW